jgi:hypothetical protein
MQGGNTAIRQQCAEANDAQGMEKSLRLEVNCFAIGSNALHGITTEGQWGG